MRQSSISSKLSLGFISVFVVLLLINLAGLFRMEKIQGYSQELESDFIPGMVITDQMERGLSSFRRNQLHWAVATDPNEIKMYASRVLDNCMVVIEETKVFSRELLKQYDIKSPSHVSQAINAAISRHIIDESRSHGRIQFDDPFFAAWLKGLFCDGIVY
ncbi:hypothetical protein WDW86_15205 [Bdellovibrionota bacterium FG-2]